MHMCLAAFYFDGMNYQENALPRQNKLDGHDVSIVASTLVMDSGSSAADYPVLHAKPARYLNEDGIPVIRLPYRRICPFKMLSGKLHMYQGVYRAVSEFAPDAVLFHGAGSYELLTLAKYKRRHPGMKLYVDNHGFWQNSATNILSHYLLHRGYYRHIVQRAMPCVDKFFGVTLDCMRFLKDMYGVPEEMIEFFPLGGSIYGESEREARRKSTREQYKLTDKDIVIVHSGKMAKGKRTLELVRGFSSVKDERLQLFLLGTLVGEVEGQIKTLLSQDGRIHHLGWQDRESLMNWLCAADMYAQPGSQSATLQNAMCCGCPIMVYPYSDHEPFLKANGYYVQTEHDIAAALRDVAVNTRKLQMYSVNSLRIAADLLDYRKLAARLYI